MNDALQHGVATGDLGLPDWEEAPVAALASLSSGQEWVRVAQDTIPELLDLRDAHVRGGFFAESGDARGLIWDVLEACNESELQPGTDFFDRGFRFIRHCLNSDDQDLYSPASIGFVCKIAAPKGYLEPEQLGALLGELAPKYESLMRFHYGEALCDKIIAAASGTLSATKARH